MIAFTLENNKLKCDYRVDLDDVGHYNLVRWLIWQLFPLVYSMCRQWLRLKVEKCWLGRLG